MTNHTKPETANRITANIIRAVNLTPGAAATRLNNTGVWDEKKRAFRGSRMTKGIADVLICFRGRYIEVEVKAGKDKLSLHQLARKQEIERAGGVYFEARSTEAFCTFWENYRQG